LWRLLPKNKIYLSPRRPEIPEGGVATGDAHFKAFGSFIVSSSQGTASLFIVSSDAAVPAVHQRAMGCSAFVCEL